MAKKKNLAYKSVGILIFAFFFLKKLMDYFIKKEIHSYKLKILKKSLYSIRFL